MTIPQLVKVIRPDGRIQYATRTNEGYVLNGYGFIYQSLEGEIIDIPAIPENYTHALVRLDECKTRYRAYIDLNDSWNGWRKPLIHNQDVPKLLRDIEGTLKTENGSILLTYNGNDAEDPDPIDTVQVEGVLYYDFGEIGLTFELIKKLQA